MVGKEKKKSAYPSVVHNAPLRYTMQRAWVDRRRGWEVTMYMEGQLGEKGTSAELEGGEGGGDIR